MNARIPPPEERQFLETYDPNQFDHPSVTVDVALLTVKDRELQVLLVRRAEHPYQNEWSLPGGFVRLEESLDNAASRVLRDKAGLEGAFLEQLYTFGEPDRDPRMRVISVAYYALVHAERLGTLERSGEVSLATLREREGRLEVLLETPVQLAFDHHRILEVVLERLRGKLEYAPIGFELLPDRFTLRHLQDVHETILGRALNKDSFRRKMLASGQLEATGELETNTDYRPAEYYKVKGQSKNSR